MWYRFVVIGMTILLLTVRLPVYARESQQPTVEPDNPSQPSKKAPSLSGGDRSNFILAAYTMSIIVRLEQIGNLDFPQQNGKMSTGRLQIDLPISDDGTIYQKDGGPRILKSSGDAALDRAALRILRIATSFDPLPSPPHVVGQKEVWDFKFLFTFTPEKKLFVTLQ